VAKRPPARGSFDDKRSRIAALAEAPPATALADLRAFLGDRQGYLVGEAAAVAAKLGLRALAPDLEAAFHRLLIDPVEVDKGCFGKQRVVEALHELDVDAPEVFLAGIRFEQPEGSYGGPVDTAVALRAMCANALVQMRHPGAIYEVAPLLFDREAGVRAEAAIAIGRSSIDLAAPILHVKALAGDTEPDVIGACLRGLLMLVPARYLPAVQSFLAEGDAVAEAAAIALGESRLREALPVLTGALDEPAGARLEEALLLAVALLRLEQGSDFLVKQVETAPERRAAAAISALAMSRHDERLADRVAKAVAARGSKKLTAALADKFDR
jgi:hypothetical protein